MMEDRERLDATRWGMSLSRGDDADVSFSAVVLIVLSGEEELEDAMIEELIFLSSCLFELQEC